MYIITLSKLKFCSLKHTVDPDSALSVAITTSELSTSLEEGQRFTLTCVANKSVHLQDTPSINWYDSMGNRIITDAGITVGLTVETGSGTVSKSLTFDSLDRSHSMEYRCNATIRFTPPPYSVNKAALWDVVVDSEWPYIKSIKTTLCLDINILLYYTKIKVVYFLYWN